MEKSVHGLAANLAIKCPLYAKEINIQHGLSCSSSHIEFSKMSFWYKAMYNSHTNSHLLNISQYAISVINDN
jgi:hypothetical protein